MPRNPSTSAPAATPVQVPLRVCFGAPSAAIRSTDLEAALHVALPVLAGADSHALLADATPAAIRDGSVICRQDSRCAGFAVARPEADLETATRELYQRLFALTAGLTLYRIWNYVPQINAAPDGLENYRRFCRGRSHAFEAQFGARFQAHLPAASGVGSLHGPLALAFIAGEDAAQHFENPHQIPAFEYPPAYGPRSPSFARATLVPAGPDRELYVSGTAAIRGHATVSPHDLNGQLACTRDNLVRIAEAAGAGSEFGAAQGWQRIFSIYVRRDTDLLQVKNFVERHLLRPGDEISYVQADLCRAELLVEIEAVLKRPARSG